MRKIAPVFLIISVLSACAGPIANIDPFPGHISHERQIRDRETCERLNEHSNGYTGFLATVAKECNLALTQILDRKTDLKIFDVARAYLDALHDYANAIEFLKAQKEVSRVSSDYGAYLIGHQTRLIEPMQDWRNANSKVIYPNPLTPK
jgi:hypothetical protein